MEETEFHIYAEPAMQALLEFVEDLEQKHSIEPEYDSGVLSVIMPDDKEYVINKHMPSRQIWVSSPYTGAGYYEWNGGNWVPKRSSAGDSKDLIQFIRDEIMLHLA